MQSSTDTNVLAPQKYLLAHRFYTSKEMETGEMDSGKAKMGMQCHRRPQTGMSQSSNQWRSESMINF